jgi:hypothetical protein
MTDHLLRTTDDLSPIRKYDNDEQSICLSPSEARGSGNNTKFSSKPGNGGIPRPAIVLTHTSGEKEILNQVNKSSGAIKSPPPVAIENRTQTRNGMKKNKRQLRTNQNIELALLKELTLKPPASKSASTTHARSVVSSRRSMSDWDSLTRKSSTIRQTSAKDKEKDDLIRKLKRQVDQLQQQQKESKLTRQQKVEDYEAKLEDLKNDNKILIQHLTGERNDLQAKLIQAQEKMHVMELKREQASEESSASIVVMQAELAQAQERIQAMELDREQLAKATSSSRKVDVSRERDKIIDSQIQSSPTDVKAVFAAFDGETAEAQDLRVRGQSTETYLKNNFFESHSPPLDVQAAMLNLQDELEASKQVIFQQKEQLRLLITRRHGDEGDQDLLEEDNDWKLRYQQIQTKHSQLQNDRAWGEFQLRNRITNDSLKYRRRLLHWKEEVQELENKVQVLREFEPMNHAASGVPHLVPVGRR